jgi:hypothetical protein
LIGQKVTETGTPTIPANWFCQDLKPDDDARLADDGIYITLP